MYIFSEVLYSALITVNGINLTPREVDTIACLLSGKGRKSIAAFLGISPRTIETHLRNLMLKFECNSREEIITTIEKTNQFSLFKEHYAFLLRSASFKQALQKFAKLPQQTPHLLALYSQSADAQKVLGIFVHYLKIAGINIISVPQFPRLVSLPETLPIIGILLRKEHSQEENPLCCFISHPITDIPHTLKNTKFIDLCMDHTQQQQELEDFIVKVFIILKAILPPSQQLEALINDFQKDKDSATSRLLSANETQTLPIQKSQLLLSRFFTLSFFKRKVVVIAAVVGCMLSVSPLFYLFFHDSSSVSVRADLALPHKKKLLKREQLLKRIEASFSDQESDIKSVTLVGIGGAGKTTLAHLYSRTQTCPVVWEINAETKENLRNSFIELAYALAKTPEQKNEWLAIQKITDLADQEKYLLYFVKNLLKKASPWLLIYNNVETITTIKNFFPDDPQVWGKGKTLITTRDINSQNTNYTDPKAAIVLDALTHKESQTLLTQILYESSSTPLSSTQQQEIQQFLQYIPPYPLDISLAGYYIKNTQISLSHYVAKIQNFTEEWDQAQAAFLKDADHYTKTRYGIIKTSLEEIISTNAEFYPLLVLLCLLSHQDIPKDLLDQYKKLPVVDLFLRQLKKQALIATENTSVLIPTITFSLHANIQALGEYFLINDLKGHLTNSLLTSIIDNLSQYTTKAREQNNAYLLNLLIKHYEKLTTHQQIFSQEQIGCMQGELGILYAILGQAKRAQKLLEQSLKLLKQYNEKNHEGIIQISAFLGYTYQDLGTYHEAKDTLLTAEHLCQQHLSPHHKMYAFVLVNLGKVYSKLGDYQKTITYFEKGISLYHSYQDHQNIAWASTYLANVYRRLGKYQKAKNLLEDGITLYQKYFPEHYANIALALVHLGQVYRELENDQKAEMLTQQGLRTYQQYFPNNHSKIAWALAQLGNIYRGLKKYTLAMNTIEQSLQLYQNHLPENKLKRHETLIALAKVYRDCGDLQKAQALLDESLRIFQIHYGHDHVETGKVYLELGRLLYLKEELALAEALLQRARAIFQKTEHPKQLLCLEYLGDLALKHATDNQYHFKNKQKFQTQAHQYFQQALVCLEQSELLQSPSFIRLQQKLGLHDILGL